MGGEAYIGQPAIYVDHAPHIGRVSWANARSQASQSGAGKVVESIERRWRKAGPAGTDRWCPKAAPGEDARWPLQTEWRVCARGWWSRTEMKPACRTVEDDRKTPFPFPLPRIGSWRWRSARRRGCAGSASTSVTVRAPSETLAEDVQAMTTGWVDGLKAGLVLDGGCLRQAMHGWCGGSGEAVTISRTPTEGEISTPRPLPWHRQADSSAPPCSAASAEWRRAAGTVSWSRTRRRTTWLGRPRGWRRASGRWSGRARPCRLQPTQPSVPTDAMNALSTPCSLTCRKRASSRASSVGASQFWPMIAPPGATMRDSAASRRGRHGRRTQADAQIKLHHIAGRAFRHTLKFLDDLRRTIFEKRP